MTYSTGQAGSKRSIPVELSLITGLATAIFSGATRSASVRYRFNASTVTSRFFGCA